MGCDIHMMIERKNNQREWRRWINSGDPDIGRNYALFAWLAGVRSGRQDIEPLSKPRGVCYYKSEIQPCRTVHPAEPDDYSDACCPEFVVLVNDWGPDGHSHSWLTLRELKNGTPPEWAAEDAETLISRMELWREGWRTDDDIRVVFFFDN